MSFDSQKIFDLLPAIYRKKDDFQGHTLKALIDIIAREAGVMEDDIAKLYDNLFIETCDEWVVPYIGDLLGVKNTHHIVDSNIYSQRAYVANTIGYRRRKGTVSVLEQLVMDVTGWRARVIEFFDLLITTQNLNHVRQRNFATAHMSNLNSLDLINTAHDRVAHYVDVRSIKNGIARHNIHNIGLFIWRLQSYPLNKVTARLIQGSSTEYSFSPLGNEISLFNQPQTEKKITHLAEEKNVPGKLRWLKSYKELESLRQNLTKKMDEKYALQHNDYFGVNPVVKIYKDDVEVPSKELGVCKLNKAITLPLNKPYQKKDGNIVNSPISAAIDPALGKIVIHPPNSGQPKIEVSYSYGFSGDVGGGPYNRIDSIPASYKEDVKWHVGVSKNKTSVKDEVIFTSLKDAIIDWNKNRAGTKGVISIMDNCTYNDDLTEDNGGNLELKIKPGSRLMIIAAKWPVRNAKTGSTHQDIRNPGDVIADQLRPHIQSDIKIIGLSNTSGNLGGELVLNGLLIEGNINVDIGNLRKLQLYHCTLAPMASSGVLAILNNFHLQIMLSRCIAKSIILTDANVSQLTINECIIDHENEKSVLAGQNSIEIKASTFFGDLSAGQLGADNSIFMGNVEIIRTQTGCVRFSYFMLESKEIKIPRRFRCQPYIEIKRLEDIKKDLYIKFTEQDRMDISKQVTRWLVPAFTSTNYGHHAYGQLSHNCPELIKTGAEDGSEMGAFGFLKQPQRESNLKTALEEYLNLGLEAGLIYVT